MNGLTAIIAILALFAFLFLASSARHVRNSRYIRATGSLAVSAVNAALATAGAVIFMSYLGYQRLTTESLVGDVLFTQDAADEFTARLMLEGRLDQLLPLRGDEWQLDARVVTWKPPATILGLEPVYQLERLSGRYSTVERERSEPRTVHSLADERPLDLWSTVRRFPRFAPGVDAYYGTATYLPMADGARYRVTMSRDALVARPVNDIAREAVGDWGRGRDDE